MISPGRYAAAAKGPKNAAAKGGASLNTLRAPHAASQSSGTGFRITGSDAGLRQAKKAYIQPIGEGYDSAPLRSRPEVTYRNPGSFAFDLSGYSSSTNYSTKNLGYERVLVDRQLMRLL